MVKVKKIRVDASSVKVGAITTKVESNPSKSSKPVTIRMITTDGEKRGFGRGNADEKQIGMKRESPKSRKGKKRKKHSKDTKAKETLMKISATKLKLLAASDNNTTNGAEFDAGAEAGAVSKVKKTKPQKKKKKTKKKGKKSGDIDDIFSELTGTKKKSEKTPFDDPF